MMPAVKEFIYLDFIGKNIGLGVMVPEFKY